MCCGGPASVDQTVIIYTRLIHLSVWYGSARGDLCRRFANVGSVLNGLYVRRPRPPETVPPKVCVCSSLNARDAPTGGGHGRGDK